MPCKELVSIFWPLGKGEQNVRMSAQAVGAAGLAGAPRGGGHGQAGRMLTLGLPHRAGSKGSLGGGGSFLHLAVLSSCFLSIERSDNALLTQLPGLLVDNSTCVRVSSGAVPCRSPASRLAVGRSRWQRWLVVSQGPSWLGWLLPFGFPVACLPFSLCPADAELPRLRADQLPACLSKSSFGRPPSPPV